MKDKNMGLCPCTLTAQRVMSVGDYDSEMAASNAYPYSPSTGSTSSFSTNLSQAFSGLLDAVSKPLASAITASTNQSGRITTDVRGNRFITDSTGRLIPLGGTTQPSTGIPVWGWLGIAAIVGMIIIPVITRRK